MDLWVLNSKVWHHPMNLSMVGRRRKVRKREEPHIGWHDGFYLQNCLFWQGRGGVKNTKPNIENTEEMNGKLTSEQMKIAPFKFSFISNEFTLFSSLNKFVSFLWIFFLYICFTIYGCKWWNNIISYIFHAKK